MLTPKQSFIREVLSKVSLNIKEKFTSQIPEDYEKLLFNNLVKDIHNYDETTLCDIQCIILPKLSCTKNISFEVLKYIISFINVSLLLSKKEIPYYKVLYNDTYEVFSRYLLENFLPHSTIKYNGAMYRCINYNNTRYAFPLVTENDCAPQFILPYDIKQYIPDHNIPKIEEIHKEETRLVKIKDTIDLCSIPQNICGDDFKKNYGADQERFRNQMAILLKFVFNDIYFHKFSGIRLYSFLSLVLDKYPRPKSQTSSEDIDVINTYLLTHGDIFLKRTSKAYQPKSVNYENEKTFFSTLTRGLRAPLLLKTFMELGKTPINLTCIDLFDRAVKFFNFSIPQKYKKNFGKINNFKIASLKNYTIEEAYQAEIDIHGRHKKFIDGDILSFHILSFVKFHDTPIMIEITDWILYNINNTDDKHKKINAIFLLVFFVGNNPILRNGTGGAFLTDFLLQYMLYTNDFPLVPKNYLNLLETQLLYYYSKPDEDSWKMPLKHYIDAAYHNKPNELLCPKGISYSKEMFDVEDEKMIREYRNSCKWFHKTP